jgi:hypothetical protein
MSLCSSDWLFKVEPNLHQVHATLGPPCADVWSGVLNAVLDQIRLARVEPLCISPAVNDSSFVSRWVHRGTSR